MREPASLAINVRLYPWYAAVFFGDSFATSAVAQVLLAAGLAFNSGTDTSLHFDSLHHSGAKATSMIERRLSRATASLLQDRLDQLAVRHIALAMADRLLLGDGTTLTTGIHVAMVMVIDAVSIPSTVNYRVGVGDG